jgi:hypothetical protein
MTATDAFFATDTRPAIELPDVPVEIPRHKGDKRPWIRNATDAGPVPDVVRATHRDGSPITVLVDPKDSRRGRYYSRASSYGSLLDDKYKIQRATQRRIVWAMGRHSELVMRAQAVKDMDERGDRDELEAIADKANEYGKGDAAATRGTAFHRLRERRDQGEDLSYLDPLTLAGLAAWERLLAPFELIGSEQFVVNDELEAAGTYDALLLAERTITIRHPKSGEVLGAVERGESVVGDLKSGRWGPEWFGVVYSCQAFVYSSGRPYSHAGGRKPWPGGQDPSQRWAVIPYVSLDRLDDAGLHWIDLERARKACELVRQVKAARTDKLAFIPHQDEPMPADLAAAGQRAVGDKMCLLCHVDDHRCPGCGEPTPHEHRDVRSACLECARGTLLVMIGEADGKDALSRLWELHAAIWTPEHTAAGQARLVQLAGGAG